MLYYLMKYLERVYEPPGFQIIDYSTVRAALAAITALLISLFIGRSIIEWLRTKQLGETVRAGIDAGVVDHSHKQGTPTMGGLIILLSVLGATLLWGAIAEVYVWLILVATAWMGAFGFADDYIKVVRKNKTGLSARIKLTGQITLGLLVGSVLYFHPEFSDFRTLTYLPFVKNETLDYDIFQYFISGVDLGWLIYIPIVIFILTALSNAVNLTDGLDGLAVLPTVLVGGALGVFAYVTGNINFADYLGIPYIAGSGEILVFCATLAGAGLGFLWFNTYPAQVFMGDIGALSLGAALGVVAVVVRQEIVLAIMGGVFVVETVSVMIQVASYKLTGRRVFRMAPLHHHFELKGWAEPKVIVRFWIITVILVLIGFASLKIR